MESWISMIAENNISALADLKSLICYLFFNFFFSTTSKKPHIYHGNYFEKNKIM